MGNLKNEKWTPWNWGKGFDETVSQTGDHTAKSLRLAWCDMPRNEQSRDIGFPLPRYTQCSNTYVLRIQGKDSDEPAVGDSQRSIASVSQDFDYPIAQNHRRKIMKCVFVSMAETDVAAYPGLNSVKVH